MIDQRHPKSIRTHSPRTIPMAMAMVAAALALLLSLLPLGAIDIPVPDFALPHTLLEFLSIVAAVQICTPLA